MKKIINKIKKIFSLPKEVKEINNSPFKPLKRVFRISFKPYKHLGTPYFAPWNYQPYIISIKRKIPKYHRSYRKFLGFYYKFGWPIYIRVSELGWKDKYDTPRFEWVSAKYFYFFNIQIAIHYVPEDEDYDSYFEQYLWWKYYSDKNINKAKETWPWINSKTKESTWKDKYLN